MKHSLFILSLLCCMVYAKPPTVATASWLVANSQTANPAVNPANPTVIHTIIKMEIEKGWHIYWSNPGESGFTPSIKTTLPEGWKIGNIEFPAPISFKTGDLFGYGYEHAVYLPISLTPPLGFNGELPEFTANLTWLACNDSACLPGQEEIKLTNGGHSKIIAASYAALPKEIPEAVLSFSLVGNDVLLELTLPNQSGIDPATFEVLPVTPDFIDPSARPQFIKHPEKNNTWTVSAPKSKYIKEDPKMLQILLKNKAAESYIISSGKP